MDPFALFTGENKTCIREEFQVMRERGLRQVEIRLNIAGAKLPTGKNMNNAHSRFVR